MAEAGSVDAGDLAVTVSCRVRNTGDRAGQEIVQLYVGDPAVAVARPPRELKGFAKVDAGARRRAAGRVRSSDPATSPTGRPGRRLGRRTRRVHRPIGASSRDLRLSETIDVEATRRPAADRMSTLEEWLADPDGERVLRDAIGTDARREAGRHPGQRGDAAHAGQLPGVHTGRVRRVRAQPRAWSTASSTRCGDRPRRWPTTPSTPTSTCPSCAPRARSRGAPAVRALPVRRRRPARPGHRVVLVRRVRLHRRRPRRLHPPRGRAAHLHHPPGDAGRLAASAAARCSAPA